MTRSPEVSVVLPAYNEADTLGTTVESTLEQLADFLPPDSFEVIVAEDGCEDRTAEIADRLAAGDERVRHLHSDERLGRGGALERAFRTADGTVLVYLDTDRATDMRHLPELVESVRSGAYDVATGSRWMSGHVADRPVDRAVASRGYNGLVRLFLRSELRDHQCGFKAFDRDALFDLLEDVDDSHWFWDTEVLVRAQREGYRVKEFAVDWEPKGDTAVDLVSDVFEMGSQIVTTWLSLSVRPRITRPVAAAAGVGLTVAALGLMLVYLDPGTVLAELSRADPTLIAAATAIYALSWPIRGVRYRDILAELGFREQVGLLTGAVFISQTGNLVFPTRAGDAIRAYIVKSRRAVPYPSGFASLAIERVYDLLTITLLAGAVLVGFVLTGGGSTLASALAEAGRAGRTAMLVAGGVGLVTTAAGAWALGLGRSGRDLGDSNDSRGSDTVAGRIRIATGRFLADVQQGIDTQAALGRVAFSSVVIWLLDAITAVTVLVALGASIEPALLVVVGVLAVSVGNLAKVLPLSPGGIGLYEAAFTLLIVALTPIAAPLAFSAALLDHAVKNAFTVVGGVGSMALLNVSLTTGATEGKAARLSDSTAGNVHRSD